MVVSSMSSATKIKRLVDNIFLRVTLTLTYHKRDLNTETGHKSSLNLGACNMVQSQLTSTLSRFLCGSLEDLYPDWQHLPPRGPWKQWEATTLCGSQPPLFSHCHFRISTHSFNIPLRPPLYRSTLSHYSSSHLFLMRETA